MKTIFILGIVVTALILVGLAVNLDVRLSAGSYDPESMARAAVIRQMGPQATAQALETARGLAAIEQARASEAAAQDLKSRQQLKTLLTWALLVFASLSLGLLAGGLAFVLVNVLKRAQAPATLTITPYMAIVRDPGGGLRVLDILTGANYPLLADRQPDRLRAESLAQVEIAGLLAQHTRDMEVIPAMIPQAVQPPEFRDYENQ